MGAPRITLVGYRGCGKSSLGTALAAALDLPVIDLDHELEARSGRPIPAIFAESGEAAFRDLEAAVLAAVLDEGVEAILATGGGVVERPGNRRLLRDRARPVVYLAAPAPVLAARLMADAGGRPSLTGAGVAAEVATVLERRDPWYREVADHVLDAARSPEQLLVELQRIVESSWRKPG